MFEDFFAVLGFKLRTFCMLGKCFSTELNIYIYIYGKGRYAMQFSLNSQRLYLYPFCVPFLCLIVLLIHHLTSVMLSVHSRIMLTLLLICSLLLFYAYCCFLSFFLFPSTNPQDTLLLLLSPIWETFHGRHPHGPLALLGNSCPGFSTG